MWAGFAGILLLVYVIASSGLFKSPPDGWLFWYGIVGVSFLPGCALLYRHGFERQRWSNSDYSPYVSDDE
jgi:hypothetical protein